MHKNKPSTRDLGELVSRYSSERDIVLKEYSASRDALEKKRDSALSKLEDIYGRSAAKVIYATLNNDFHILQQRSALSGLKKEDFEKAKKVLEALGKLEDLGEGLEDAQLRLLEKNNTQTVSSYVSEVQPLKAPAYQLYLVVPVDGKSNELLAEHLDEKVESIVSAKKLFIERQSLQPVSMEYSYSRRLVNNFAVYTINFEDLSNIRQHFVNVLKAKIEELQPDSFGEMGLLHSVDEMPYMALHYFANNDVHASKNQETDANKDRTGKLNFNSIEPREIRNEAMARLNAVEGDFVNSIQFASILGLSYHGAIINARKVTGRSKAEGQFMLPKTGVEKFIKSHRPTGNGWSRKKPKRNSTRKNEDSEESSN